MSIISGDIQQIVVLPNRLRTRRALSKVFYRRLDTNHTLTCIPQRLPWLTYCLHKWRLESKYRGSCAVVTLHLYRLIKKVEHSIPSQHQRPDSYDVIFGSSWTSSSVMPSADAYPSPPTTPAKVDPVLRNALRYTISAKEYETLHQYLITKSPPAVRERVPQPQRYEAIVKSKNDYNAAAVRASVRVFLATQTGLKIWDLITTHVLARGIPQK